MGSRERELRRQIQNSGDPFGHHSMNQAILKKVFEDRKRGRDSKAIKAELRRREQEELEEDQKYGNKLVGSRREFQLGRALEHVSAGTATPEDWDYIDRQGRTRVSGTSPKGRVITITLVDLPRPNGIDSKALGQEEVLNAA